MRIIFLIVAALGIGAGGYYFVKGSGAKGNTTSQTSQIANKTVADLMKNMDTIADSNVKAQIESLQKNIADLKLPEKLSGNQVDLGNNIFLKTKDTKIIAVRENLELATPFSSLEVQKDIEGSSLFMAKIKTKFLEALKAEPNKYFSNSPTDQELENNKNIFDRLLKYENKDNFFGQTLFEEVKKCLTGLNFSKDNNRNPMGDILVLEQALALIKTIFTDISNLDLASPTFMPPKEYAVCALPFDWLEKISDIYLPGGLEFTYKDFSKVALNTANKVTLPTNNKSFDLIPSQNSDGLCELLINTTNEKFFTDLTFDEFNKILAYNINNIFPRTLTRTALGTTVDWTKYRPFLEKLDADQIFKRLVLSVGFVHLISGKGLTVTKMDTKQELMNIVKLNHYGQCIDPRVTAIANKLLAKYDTVKEVSGDDNANGRFLRFRFLCSDVFVPLVKKALERKIGEFEKNWSLNGSAT